VTLSTSAGAGCEAGPKPAGYGGSSTLVSWDGRGETGNAVLAGEQPRETSVAALAARTLRRCAERENGKPSAWARRGRDGSPHARDRSTARGSTWGSASAPWSESWHSPAVSTATSRCRSTPDLFHAFLKNSAETRKTPPRWRRYTAPAEGVHSDEGSVSGARHPAQNQHFARFIGQYRHKPISPLNLESGTYRSNGSSYWTE
jgi:hypothetical protein